jgi:transposase-like protein
MAGFLGLDELFDGRHFDREVIVLCVRWYLRFKLSFRDLAEMMAERGLTMVHTTIMRWCTTMLRSLSGAGSGSHNQPGIRGGSMRPT